MVHSKVTSGVEPILDTMIGLTRLTPLQRVIVAGSESMELYLELQRRGFFRATTPELCRRPRLQHTIGFIADHAPITGVEPGLDQISALLAVNAELALLIGEGQNGLKIGRKLE